MPKQLFGTRYRYGYSYLSKTNLKYKKGGKALHKKIFARIRKAENNAFRAYSKNNMKRGLAYERKADNIYKKFYWKIFTKKRGKK